MGNSKRFHTQVIDDTWLPFIYKTFVAWGNFAQDAFHSIPRFHSGIDRHVKLSGKYPCPLHMVNMLMGDKQSVDLVTSERQFFQSFQYPLTADACIDENFRMFCAHKQAVAAAAAGNGTKIQGIPLLSKIFHKNSRKSSAFRSLLRLLKNFSLIRSHG